MDLYKLLIVDDEEDVRQGIIKKVDWAVYGFTVIGEAENGEEAIEVVEKLMPDVVMTDIHMPFIDGLTFCSIINSNYPTIKFIIFTGFDEFEYAKTAISLNVVEYVLKPASSKELAEVLIRVKDKLDKEMAERKDLNRLQEYYINSIPILREKFLSTLMTVKQTNNAIVDKAQAYNIDLNANEYVVALIRCDTHSITNKSQFKIPDDEEILNISVINIVNEVLSNDKAICFSHTKYIAVIFMVDNIKEINKIEPSLNKICQAIEKYLGFTVTIGLGSYFHSIENINTSYKNALAALDYRAILGTGRVIFIDDMEKIDNDISVDEISERKIVSALKVGTKEEISKIIDDLIQNSINSQISIKEYQLYLFELITIILKTAKSFKVDMDNLFGKNYNFFIRVSEIGSPEELKNWILEVCLKINSSISKERTDTSKQLINSAIDFIKENYVFSDLTIDKVSKHLHISPTYFSTIFKKETKTTFINYLTEIRLSQAVELLRSTDLRTFEISEQVGYSEANYFSYVFKKHYGVSPSKYRNNNNR